MTLHFASTWAMLEQNSQHCLRKAMAAIISYFLIRILIICYKSSFFVFSLFFRNRCEQIEGSASTGIMNCKQQAILVTKQTIWTPTPLPLPPSTVEILSLCGRSREGSRSVVGLLWGGLETDGRIYVRTDEISFTSWTHANMYYFEERPI